MAIAELLIKARPCWLPAAWGLLAGIFLLDLAFPRRGLIVFYLIPLLLTALCLQWRGTVLLAAAATFFTVLGVVLAPPGASEQSVSFLRSASATIVWWYRPVALGILWITALFIVLFQRMGASIRERSKQFQMVMDHATDMICCLNLMGEVQWGNQQMAHLVGQPVDQLRGRPFDSLLAPASAALAGARLASVRRGEPVLPLVEMEFIGADGATWWMEASFQSVEEGGRVVGRMMVARDITDRKKAEAKLSLYQQAIMHSTEAIVFLDFGGHYIEQNAAHRALFGYSNEELLGRTPVMLLGEETFSAIFQALATEGSYTGEAAAHVKTGKLINLHLQAFVVRDDEGRPHCYAMVKRDLTKYKILEEQLRHSQKLEMLGRFVGGITHNFNNLLTVINGYSSLALTRLGSQDTVRSDLEEIQKASQRAATLTSQLLAFTRQQVPNFQVVNLNEVMTSLEGLLLPLLREEIRLRIMLDPQLGRTRADPGQVEQVLMNLASNACDAMPRGGLLTVETANVELDMADAGRRISIVGPHVMVAVSDTGCGMDEATKAHLFEPFFTTKPPGQGTGLGLSTVYGIVKQNGGSIWVDSEVGTGTTVRVYLPRADESAEPQPAVPAKSAAPHDDMRGMETLLLVEDEAAVRQLLGAALRASGYTVLEAPTGEEALRLEASLQGPLHLLVTDMRMPGLSGYELAAQIRTRRTAALKVLLISGYTADRVVRRSVAEGKLAFLQKPFAPDALIQKVREILDT